MWKDLRFQLQYLKFNNITPTLEMYDITVRIVEAFYQIHSSVKYCEKEDMTLPFDRMSVHSSL